MTNKTTGWAFIFLGVALLVPGLPIPDLTMSVVQYLPPTWVSLSIFLIMPLLYIVFGITTIFTKSVGKFGLLGVSSLLMIATTWAIPNLGLIRYYEPGMDLSMGSIELKVFSTAIFFILVTAFLGYELMLPNKQINRGQG